MIGLAGAGRTHGEDHVALLEGFHELLLVGAAALDGLAGNVVDHHTRGRVVGGRSALHDIQDVCFGDGIVF